MGLVSVGKCAPVGGWPRGGCPLNSPRAVAYIRTGHKIGPLPQRAVCVDVCDEAGYDLRYWVEGDLGALHAAYTVIRRGDAGVLVVAPHVLGLARPEVQAALTDAGGRLHVARDPVTPRRTSTEIAAALHRKGVPLEHIADAFGLDAAGVRALLRRGGIGRGVLVVPAVAVVGAWLREHGRQSIAAAVITAGMLAGLVASAPLIPGDPVRPPYTAPAPPRPPSTTPPAPTPSPRTEPPPPPAGDDVRRPADGGTTAPAPPAVTPPPSSPPPVTAPPSPPPCIALSPPALTPGECLADLPPLPVTAVPSAR